MRAHPTLDHPQRSTYARPMPVAIITFMLPEDRREYDLANQGEDLASVLDDLDNRLRAKIKYTLDSDTTPYQEARTWLHDLCRDYGVELHRQ